jgi:hypothetical protein
MKRIERIKSSKESNSQQETIGEKLSQFRSKLNEIIDHINEKEKLEDYKKSVEEYISELISENLSSDDIIIESDN